MSRAPVSARRLMSVAVMAALVVSFVPMAFGGSAPPPSTAGPASTVPGTVVSASQQASGKLLAPSLQEAAAKAGSGRLDVLVMLAAGAKAPAALETPLQLRLRADKQHAFFAGRVRADLLVKLATSKGVEFVADNGRREPAPLPDVKKRTRAQALAANAPMRAALKAATKIGVVKRFADSVNSRAAVTGGGTGAPTGWHDVGPTHGSAAAWANGFTGSGVKVAVADDGMDFGHPDLQGTQAYNTSGDYWSWPMAFDPFSTYLYALDQTLGTNYTASAGWFVSTVATTTGSWQGVNYTMPGTSLSGVYHIGKLKDANLRALWFGDYPTLIVADENTAGVYDTVYVDLNFDANFTNDKKLTRSDPISYLDFVDAAGNPGTDGVADISGGMLYWISDGTHHPPMADVEFDSRGWTPPRSGDLVCMMGAYDYYSDHGTLCGSNVVGQGVIDGASIYGDYPSFKPSNTWTTGGVVQGAGKRAGLVAISDVYQNFEASTLMAYDFVTFGNDGRPNTGDEIQVISNSYGDSATDNDEWDYPSRYVSMLNKYYAPTTTFLFSTGNGGPGYGTNAPPSPSTGVGVGASTQMGADGGWDSIDTLGQVTYGDVIPFSNRGPSAMGHEGPAIVADGAYASGAMVLSLANGNGWTAWDIWGGTSRSCPVAAGNMTLIYQAFRSKNGRWPTYAEARDLMASGATDLNYDTLVQGSGSVNADRSTRLAGGLDGGGVLAAPSAWSPGSFRGLKAEAFQQVLHPGEFDSGTLKVTNPSANTVSVGVSDSWMQRTQTVTMSVTLDPAQESAYDFNRPDKLVDLTSMVPGGADLMVVRATIPFSEFDPDSDYVAENRIRLLTYDWTDRNVDAALWNDTNNNGAVNAGEIEPNEYMRFTYSNATGTSLENRVQRPLDRMHDGVFLGVQHQLRTGAPVHVEVEVSFWSRADMPWLGAGATSFSLAPGASRSLPTFVAVPADAPLGTYEGEFRLTSDGTTTTVVPVIMTVAGDSSEISFGGANPYEQLQDTGKVFGFTDWAWRAEAGDWRFFSTDVPETTPVTPGTLWLAHTTWSGLPTDLDTLLYGPVRSAFNAPAFTGPYDLGLKGGSPNTNASAGVWRFNTATGSTEDWVTGKLDRGLNTLMIHNVLYNGAPQGVGFSGQTGRMAVQPGSADLVDTLQSHSLGFGVMTSMALAGFQADAYGLTHPWSSADATVAHHAYWDREFDMAHAGYIESWTLNGDSDIDLFLQRWNGASWVTLAVSEGSTGDEYVRLVRPTDGHYRMRVYGWSVPSGTTTFTAGLTVPQGNDITLSGVPAGPVAADTTITMNASFTKDRIPLDQRDGSFVGVVFCGPSGAGSAVEVPISMRYPFKLASSSPAMGASNVPTSAAVLATFSKRVETATVRSATFYLRSGTTTVTGAVSYDRLSATARLVAPLSADTTYTAVLSPSIVAADGDAWSGATFTFHTVAPLVAPTWTTLDIPATWVRYGKTTQANVESRIALVNPAGFRSAGWLTGPDAGARMAMLFQPQGGSTWTTVATGVTDALGHWHPMLTATQAGYYKAVRLRTPAALGSVSNLDGFGIMFDPVLKASATRVRHGTSIRMDVTVRPGSVSKGRTVAVQRWNGLRWVTYRYVGLSASGLVTFFEYSGVPASRRIRVVIGPYAGWGGTGSNAVTLTWY